MATQLGADFVQAHKDAEKDDSAFKDFIRYMTYSVATQLGKGATDAVLTKFNESAVNNKKALWDTSKGQDYDGKYDTLSRTTQTVKDRLKKADAAGDALSYYRDLGYTQAIPRFRVNNKTGVTYSDASLKLLLQEEVDEIAKANLKKDRDLLAFADKNLLTPDQFAQHKSNINFRSGNVVGRQFNKIRNMFSDKDLETQRWAKIYEGDPYKNMNLLQEKIKEMAQKGVDPSSFAEILDKIEEEKNTLGYNRYDPQIIAGMKIIPEYSEKEVPNNDGSIDDVTIERKFNPQRNRIEVREVSRRTAKIDDSYLLGKSETIADYIKGRQFLPAVALQIENDLISNFDVKGADLNSNISFKKFGEYQQVIDFIAKKYNSNMANYESTAVGKLAQLDIIDQSVKVIPELYEAVMSGEKLDPVALIQLKRIKNAAVARSAVKNNWGKMDEQFNLLPLGHISGGVNPDTGEVLAMPDPKLGLRPEQINEYNIRFQRGMNGYPFSTGQSVQAVVSDDAIKENIIVSPEGLKTVTYDEDAATDVERDPIEQLEMQIKDFQERRQNAIDKPPKNLREAKALIGLGGYSILKDQATFNREVGVLTDKAIPNYFNKKIIDLQKQLKEQLARQEDIEKNQARLEKMRGSNRGGSLLSLPRN